MLRFARNDKYAQARRDSALVLRSACALRVLRFAKNDKNAQARIRFEPGIMICNKSIAIKVITNKVVTFWVCDVPWLMWCTEKLISFLKFTIFIEKRNGLSVVS